MPIHRPGEGRECGRRDCQRNSHTLVTAQGAETKIPFYGCSHFESIQFVKVLLDETPEGKGYE